MPTTEIPLQPDLQPHPSRGQEQRLASRRRAAAQLSGSCAIGLLASIPLGLAGAFPFSWTDWCIAFAASAISQGLLWLAVESGFSERWQWDRHFIYQPGLILTVLLSLAIYLTPELRMALLMVWFVALLFFIGLAGFSHVIVLASVLTAGYLAAITQTLGDNLDFRAELFVAIEFWSVNLMAAFVFAGLRKRFQAGRRRYRALAESSPVGIFQSAPDGLCH